MLHPCERSRSHLRQRAYLRSRHVRLSDPLSDQRGSRRRTAPAEASTGHVDEPCESRFAGGACPRAVAEFWEWTQQIPVARKPTKSWLRCWYGTAGCSCATAQPVVDGIPTSGTFPGAMLEPEKRPSKLLPVSWRRRWAS